MSHASMDTCLYCAVDPRDSPLSEEHVVPAVLGGWLTHRCVCKLHNEQLGTDFESKLKRNAFVAHALHAMKLQPFAMAYRQGKVMIETPDGRELLGKIEGGKPKLTCQGVSADELVAPEEDAKAILRKLIEKLQKRDNILISWNENDFDSFPYERLCHIPETGISFSKKMGGPGFVRIDNLDGSIPFQVPAKIAFTHLAALGCPFVQSPSFNPLKTWILRGGDNHFALLGRRIDALEPSELDFKPYHYIKYHFAGPHLLAVVTLFSAIRFGVYLAELPDLPRWPQFSALERYHVYDLHKKVVFPSHCQGDLERDHLTFLDAVLAWRGTQPPT
jgi:HNH endonuclease